MSPGNAALLACFAALGPVAVLLAGVTLMLRRFPVRAELGPLRRFVLLQYVTGVVAGFSFADLGPTPTVIAAVAPGMLLAWVVFHTSRASWVARRLAERVFRSDDPEAPLDALLQKVRSWYPQNDPKGRARALALAGGALLFADCLDHAADLLRGVDPEDLPESERPALLYHRALACQHTGALAEAREAIDAIDRTKVPALAEPVSNLEAFQSLLEGNVGYARAVARDNPGDGSPCRTSWIWLRAGILDVDGNEEAAREALRTLSRDELEKIARRRAPGSRIARAMLTENDSPYR